MTKILVNQAQFDYLMVFSLVAQTTVGRPVIEHAAAHERERAREALLDWVEIYRSPQPSCEIYPETLERCRLEALSDRRARR